MLYKKNYGVEAYFLCDKRIMYYRLRDMRRNTVDAWVGIIKEHFDHCARLQIPVASLNHFMSADVLPTPYSNARGKDISASMPDLPGYTAFAMPETQQSVLMQGYMRNEMEATRKRILFFTVNQAYGWLKNKLDIVCDEPLPPE